MTSPLPVCIDLDGTLLRTDVLSEALLIFVRRYPFKIGILLYWFLQGRMVLKHRIAERISLPIDLLPVNQQILEKIHSYKAQGHSLYLVTAAPYRYALACATRFKVFDEVLSSDLHVNLRREEKARLLVNKFGKGGYIYAGNSRHDVPVWTQAGEIIAINTPKTVLKKIRTFQKPLTIFFEKECQGKDFFKNLGYYFHFSKGFTFFATTIGYLVVRKTTENHLLKFFNAFLIFGEICLIKSGFWILIDLFQVNSLRENLNFSHPIANGALPLGQTLRTALFLIVLSITLQILTWPIFKI